ncbi:MAG: hypothetical protein MKZ95_16500 [Pirellulales bacterium]|nr:hypothetical protein [Pirellulales bacterium]
MNIMRGLLGNREGMGPDYPPRVFLDEFNRDSLRLRILYWYHPPIYWDYVTFCEKFNLQLLRELSAVGIRLALPTNETYLATDGLHSLTKKEDMESA